MISSALRPHSSATVTDSESTERLEDTLVQLNERIARLAMSLNADIDDSAAILRILNREVDGLQHPVHEPADAHGLHFSSEYRLQRDWEELRGLLTLRCHLLTDALHDKGLKATTLIAHHAEERLTREGFQPGADGFDLLAQLPEDS